MKLIILFSLFSLVLISCGKSSLDAIDTKWDCAINICSVTFAIRNNTDNNILANYAIRAHSRSTKSGTAVGGVTSNAVVGELKGSIMVNSNSNLKINQQLKTNKRPTNIVISVWEK